MQHAYDDRPLPIGEGQTISQPYVVAFMTQVLELKSSDKVLEIGTGSGYQAAILAEICKEVYTIEIVEVLGANAKKLLESLHYKNIFAKIGDGYLGWPEASPFDAIIVTCSPTHVPQPLQYAGTGIADEKKRETRPAKSDAGAVCADEGQVRQKIRTIISRPHAVITCSTLPVVRNKRSEIRGKKHAGMRETLRSIFQKAIFLCKVK
jgi:SAM-dependent methyltransferase